MRPFEAALVSAVLCSSPALAQSVIGGHDRSAPILRRDFRLEPIAISGQAAPGVPGGTFAFFGPAPGVGGQQTGWASIGSNGRVAFGAAVDVSSGGETTTRHGLWHRVNGQLQPIVQAGDPAPGTSQTFAFLPSIYFVISPSIAQDRYLFQATLNPGGSSSQGLWSDRSGALESIATVPGTLPGLPPSASLLFVGGELVNGGLVVLNGSYSDDDDGGYVDPEQQGFWRDDGASVELVVRDDDHAPGCPPDVFFGKGTFFANGSFDHWDVNSSGRIAFNGFVKGPPLELLEDEGVWYEGPSGLTLAAREGQPATDAGPGLLFGSGAGLHSFGSAYNAPVRIAENGWVLFGAGLRGNGSDHGESVWAVRGGPPECVVKGFPQGNDADPAPGFPAGTTFQAVFSGRINSLGQVAVGATAGGVGGLWWERGGVLELVARVGGPVPGLAGATFTGWGMTLDELTDSGLLYYTGTFSGPGVDATNNQALFVARSPRDQAIALRRGQSVTVAPGDVRVVSSFGIGGSSAADVKSVKLLFTDDSTGLFTLRR